MPTFNKLVEKGENDIIKKSTAPAFKRDLLSEEEDTNTSSLLRREWYVQL
jgi:hypothetical protein